MSAARDSIKKGLMALIARKDASVFQSLENFNQEINKLGNWQNMPEIPALAAGLAERLPWELQKDGSGLVTGRILINLAGTLVKKHNITDELAVWAIETWAHSLGLKLENPTVTTEPAKTIATSSSTSNTATLGYASLIKQSRLGLIFGQDGTGAIRVFASWFREESAQQSAKFAATMVKIEIPVDRPLFSAPPAKRKAPASKTAAVEKSTDVPEHSVLPADPSAPALKKAIQAQKPVTKRPVPASRPTTRPSAPTSQPVKAPVAKNKVYYGSADSLYNQAVQLLPGHTSRPDVPEALAILNQAAKQGSLEARRTIGLVYLKGVGIEQDFKTAANWLRLAAEGGDTEAQFNLGSLYQCGMGVEFSLEKAKNLLQRAATKGHKEAQVLLNEILQG